MNDHHAKEKTSWLDWSQLRRAILYPGLRWFSDHFSGRCLWRIMWWSQDKFLVAVALVVVRGDEVLLLHHSYRGRYPWGLVTGFVAHGESLEDACHREFSEETGARLPTAAKLQLVVARFPNRRHLEVLYFVDATHSLPPAFGGSKDGEITWGAWHPLDRLPEGLMPGQSGLIRMAVHLRRAPSVH